MTHFDFGEVLLGGRVGGLDDDDEVAVGELSVRLVGAECPGQLVDDEDGRVQDLLLVSPEAIWVCKEPNLLSFWGILPGCELRPFQWKSMELS